MIDRFFQDRFGQRGIGNNRFGRESKKIDRLRRDEHETVYSLEEAVDGKPRIEWGVGNYEKIKEIGRKYENEYPPDSPFVMLCFYDVSDKRYGFAKIYFGDSKEINTTLDYIGELNKLIIEYMIGKNPDSKLKWDISVHGFDKKVSELLQEYVKERVTESYR